MTLGTPAITLDAIVFDPRTDASAAWLHDSINDTMLPCTHQQYILALHHTPEREQNHPWA